MSSAAVAPLRRPLAASVASLLRIPQQTRAASLISRFAVNKRPRIFHSPVADLPRRDIKIQPSVPSLGTKDPLGDFTTQQLAILDPMGNRQKMFARKNKDAVGAGDIIQIRRKNGEPFAGVILNIRRRGVDTAVLLRNQLTRVGVEMWFKVFSPMIEGIDMVKKREKRARRAKLYYLRKAEHDIGSVQNMVAVFTRQRAMLGGTRAGSNKKKPGKFVSKKY